MNLSSTTSLTRSKKKIPQTVKMIQGQDQFGNATINDYVFKQKLGAGSFGQVYLLQKKSTNGIITQHAVKILKRKPKKYKTFKKRKDEDPFMDESIKNQIEAMKRINQNNIVQIQQVICNEKKDDLYIIMQYCENGQMIQWDAQQNKFYSCHNRTNDLSMDQIRKLIRDLSKGLQCIFLNQAFHRDIKPQNILFDKQFNAKICDFGVTKLTPLQNLTDIKGTEYFHSPQIIRNQKSLIKGKSCDIWALGVTIYCFIYLQHPFISPIPNQDETHEETLENICNNQVKFPQRIKLDDELKDLMMRMMQKDPEKRIEMNWLNKGYEYTANQQLLKQMRQRLEMINNAKPSISIFQIGIIKQFSKKFKQKQKKKFARKQSTQIMNKILNVFFEDQSNSEQLMNTIFSKVNQNQQIVNSLKLVQEFFKIDQQKNQNLLTNLLCLHFQKQTMKKSRIKKSKFNFSISNPLLKLKIYTAQGFIFQMNVKLIENSILEFNLLNKSQIQDKAFFEISKLERILRRNPNKSWNKAQLIAQIKKLVRLIAIIDGKMIFRQIQQVI